MKKTMFIICSAIITIFSFLLYASTPITIRSGTTRNIPATGEEDWGDEVTNWIIDATAAINASPQTQYSRRFTAVVGSATEVTAGNASHSTLASAVSFASSGGSIYVMDGTHFVTSAINITKPLTIIGDGYKSFIVSSTGDFSTSAILNFQTSGITLSQITFSTSTPTQYILNLNSNATDAHIDVRVSGMATNGFMTDSTVNDNNKYGHYIWGTSGKSLNTLSYLYDASIVNPQTDDGLFRYNGQWVNKSIGGATNEINVTQSGSAVTIGIVDPLIVSKGGTGRSTIGSANQVLGVNPTATALNYKTITGTSGISVTAGDGWMTIEPTTIVTTNGGTGLTSWTSGDIPYYSSGTTLSKLGANTTTTPKCLFQTSSVPYWNTLSYTDIPISVVGTASEIDVSSGNGFFTVGIVDPLALTKGGTGRSTIGSANQMLGVNPTATALNYKTITGTSGISVTAGDGWMTIEPTTIVTTNGGTGLTSWTNGDIPYYASGTALSKLGANATTTPKCLFQTSSVPYWNTLSYTDVPISVVGTASEIDISSGNGFFTVGLVDPIAVAKGGTNNTTIGTNQITYGKGTFYTSDSNFTYNGTYVSIGISPSFSEPPRLVLTGNIIEPTTNPRGLFYLYDMNGFDTSGTGAFIGLGAKYNSGGSVAIMGGIGVQKLNSTDGNYSGDLVLWSRKNGSAIAPNFRVKYDGSIVALGIYNTTVGATNRDIYADNTGVIGYVSSSKRYKTNIRPFDSSTIENVSKLEPVKFDYIDPRRGKDQIGFIAEDVAKIFPELASYNSDGKVETIQYSKLAVVLTGGIKDLYKENKKLKARLDDLEKRLLKLEKKGN